MKANKTDEMNPIFDCNGIPYPVFTTGTVTLCEVVKGAKPEGSVFCLKISTFGKDARMPLPGQFFMLRSQKSQQLLARPISVFHAEKKSCSSCGADNCSDFDSVELSFLILQKGKGTKELCLLEADEKVQVLGPLGNVFPHPEQESGKVLIAGGGIGVAPVANFAESLPEKSYDFIASFKSGSYGLENIQPENLIITTDDGTVGLKGMITAAVDAQKIKDAGYSAVYACGPAPMLNYIKTISEEAGVKCWISMESRMACGVGVCLGCVIPTTKGNLRCCKDGPVFDSTILSFPKPKASLIGVLGAKPLGEGEADKATKRRGLQEQDSERLGLEAGGSLSPSDLSVTINGVHFQNPLIGSSGTFGFGTEYASVFDVNRLGGIASKGLTLERREGNSGIRVWETPSGLMNSIGLQNPGIPHFIEHELPEMLKLKPVAIANLSGSSLETYVEGAKLLEKTEVPIIELNISCPNVSAGGAAFGMSCASANTVVSAVRAVTKKPLWVKLTPQSPELNEVALSCVDSGADAISLCNSFQGVAIDVETGRPVFDKVKAGFGGPAVRPIAVRLIYELYDAMKTLPEEKRVPIIAIGGIATWQDVLEFIMAGATACEVGTNTFANPFTMIECIDGISAYMKRKGISSLQEICGIAHL